MYGYFSLNLVLFELGTERGVDMEWRRCGVSGKHGGRGNCNEDILCEKLTYFNKKKK